MVSSPTELHLLRGLGPCLYCGMHHDDTLGTPDDPPAIGSLVFCGACAGVHELTANLEESPRFGEPQLSKPSLARRLELLKRPDVQAIRDAFQLDQMESRMRASSTKPPKPSPPRTAGPVRLGANRLEARGPNA